MNRGLLIFAGIILAGLSGSAFAVQYVQSPPLDKVITTKVGEVSEGKAIATPIITWGGDIATTLCNGNSKTTVKGSICDKQGLSLELFREDIFQKQVEAYISGKTPFLRGTMGMINMAAEVTSRDPRTVMVPVYQLTFSTGGDMLVVRDNIKSPKDLKGKTIALQAYGPHAEYLAQVLRDAGLSMKDVSVKWTKELTGSKETPGEALKSDKGIDAVFVVSPDGMALTSNGKVGTGAEGSVKGAKILLSTKTASRVIADVYVVRADYLKANRAKVQQFTHALMLSQEALAGIVKAKATKPVEYKAAFTAAAEILLDSKQAVPDAEGLYADCEYVGFNGNVDFFTNAKNPRNFERIGNEIQTSLVGLGLLTKQAVLAHAGWDYKALRSGIIAAPAPIERFDTAQVAQVVIKRQQQGTSDSGTLFSFEVYFNPNQNEFPASQYADAFKKVVNLASTYGGAVITIEGHTDPLGYLKQMKENVPGVVLKQTEQAARNLSIGRANKVRDSVIGFAKGGGITLDPSQFAVVGYGIDQPKTGMCGGTPCAPKTEQEWRSNMRVNFRIIQIEAEASAFKPL